MNDHAALRIRRRWRNALYSACAVDPGRSSQSGGRPSKIIVLASNALWVIAHIRTLCGPRMLQRDIARELYPRSSTPSAPPSPVA